jgi:uncharacterized protein YukE
MDEIAIDPEAMTQIGKQFAAFAPRVAQVGLNFQTAVQPLVSKWGTSPTDEQWIKSASTTMAQLAEADDALGPAFGGVGAAWEESGNAWKETDSGNADMVPGAKY